MHLDILIVSYNRPAYLTALLNSLRDQHSGDYDLGELHLMQDGPNPKSINDDTEKIASCLDVFEQVFPSGHVNAAPANIGINGNYTKIVEHMASTQADAIIVLEDDLELSPHYLNVMTTLLNYAKDSSQVGMVSAMGLLGASLENQQLRKRALIPMTAALGIQRWGWGMAKATIAEYLPLLEMYLDYANRVRFPDNGDEQNRAEVFPLLQEFINQMGFYQTLNGIEIDTMYDVAAYVLGRVNLTTYANFITPIGERGIHFDEGMFRKNNYHNAVLMPEPPHDFAWWEPEMMLHVQTLIRRFYASIRLNYNSGAFGCQIPYGGLQNPDLLRALYEDILGWPLTDHDVRCHKLPHLAEDKSAWPGPATGLLRMAIPAEKQCSFPYAI